MNPTASFLLFAYAAASLVVDSLMNPYAGVAAVFAEALKMARLWRGFVFRIQAAAWIESNLPETPR